MTTTDIEHQAIHTWFGLSYSNYLVLPRTLLQSMPDEWQTRFVGCLRELHDAYDHVPQAEAYKVQPAREREVSELADDELKRIGYTVDTRSYYDDAGREVESDHIVLWPVDRDPVPHYNRGRAYIAPQLSTE